MDNRKVFITYLSLIVIVLGLLLVTVFRLIMITFDSDWELKQNQRKEEIVRDITEYLESVESSLMMHDSLSVDILEKQPCDTTHNVD